MSEAAECRWLQLRGTLVGESPAFVSAISQVPLVADSDATLTIIGETGTGKELVARAVHGLSERAGLPFVAVNCGALADTLLDDQLFGHESGAFTDARHRRSGLLAEAQKGTVFLDEVDALSERGQVVLLRVLQDRMFRPLGAEREMQADVRFVAATNAPLLSMVQRGQFRADLYYRLGVFSILLPPLRDRPEDILPLAAHFLRKHAAPGTAALAFLPAARRALLSYAWPGNVRELENAMIRCTRLCRTGAVDVEALGLPGVAAVFPGRETVPPNSLRALKRRTIDAFERDYLTRLMSEHRGNVTHSARAAGKDRRELGRLLKKHGIDPKLFSKSPVGPE